MATVRFRLEKPIDKKTGKEKATPVSIRVQLYISDKIRPEFSTGEKVVPSKVPGKDYKNWTGTRVKGHVKNYDKINKHLEEIERGLLDLWRNNKGLTKNELEFRAREIVKGTASVEAVIAEKIASIQEKKSTVDDPDLVATGQLTEYIKDYILKCRTKEIPMAKGTVQGYSQLFNLLESFSEAKKYELTYEAVTMKFYYDFTYYLWTTEGMNDNTVGKHIKNLKKFLQLALDDELHATVHFKKDKFKKPSFDSEEVYLNEDEILKVYGLNLSDSKELELTRDLFVFNCWVGIRFGDLCSIKPEQITQELSGKYLRLVTEKTQEDVIIPFHPLAEAIYSFHDMKIPRMNKNYNVEYNRNLKEIARRAGLVQKVPSKNVIRGKVKITYLEKCEMVSAHTARRSFATNCYKMGVQPLTIMAITGHKTEKSFLRYIRINKDEHAKRMMEIFNKSPMMSVMRIAN